jgi:Hypoxia induced protein conserved region.
VAIVLLLGLVNMMRGGSPNRSQQLMRLRVLLQFVAIIVIMATIWAMGRSAINFIFIGLFRCPNATTGPDRIGIAILLGFCVQWG